MTSDPSEPDGSTQRQNPFPGLRPFEANDTHLFFGREGQSEDILRSLRRSRLLAVVGASGSGKSSLVRAGLLPHLHGGFFEQAGSHWRVALLRPGGDPIEALAHALVEQSVLATKPDEAEEIQRHTQLMAAQLRRSGLGISRSRSPRAPCTRGECSRRHRPVRGVVPFRSYRGRRLRGR